MTDYIKDFKLVDHNKILVKNRNQTNEKIQNFICGGFENLLVLSDFDRTLSKPHVNGKSQLHSFALLKSSPSVPPEVRKIVTEIDSKYKPLDKDLSIPETKRNVFVNEWWTQSINSYKGLKISPEEIVSTTFKNGPPLKDHAKEFFQKLVKANVPVLLLSAGLGEYLEPLIKTMDLNSSNIELLANFLKLDNEGRIAGYQGPIIHTGNKNKVNFNGTKFLERATNRHNVLLMGDHLGDAAMAEKLENVENILKIGFFYGEAEAVLPIWLDTFDIVLKDDQTMNVPISILDLLT